jgi:hypothetical protein
MLNKRNNVWIVEMHIAGRVWGATVGIGLVRSDGRLELREWQKRNPHDRYRLVRYVNAPEEG